MKKFLSRTILVGLLLYCMMICQVHAVAVTVAETQNARFGHGPTAAAAISVMVEPTVGQRRNGRQRAGGADCGPRNGTSTPATPGAGGNRPNATIPPQSEIIP